MSLDAGGILAEAQDKAGFADCEPEIVRNLEVLCASLNRDAKLGADGEAAARRALVTRQADRIGGLKWCAVHPEILEEPVDSVFLCGLPRSGTTYFQYLFDRDRRFQLVRTWQSLVPLPPPAVDAQSVEDRKAFAREIRARTRPAEPENFAALHLYDEDGSDECHAFLEQGVTAAGFHNVFDVPTYFDWLIGDCDPIPAYRVHKRQLQLLQWRGEPKPWALKYPNHVLFMDAICDVHPAARFAITHRDPLQVLASIAKMTLTLRKTRYGIVDPARVGEQMLHFIEAHISRIMAFADGPEANRVVHVDYYALVTNPADEMARVHTALGIGSPHDVMAEITGWRRENPKNARGANDYALAQFGLNAEAVEERFAAYRSRFAIPREADAIKEMSE
ncbi:MAG: sulfotransferase family protein [Novosphingobium sp.]